MRRGQVAMEFIMTYGWALLLVLVMISTITYFGAVNPSKLLPSRCTLGAEMACEDYQIRNDAGAGVVSLILSQGVGKTIYADSLRCKYNEQEVVEDLAGQAWPPSEKLKTSCSLAEFAGLRGEKVKVLFELTYRRSTTGFSHLVQGELYTEVQ